VVRALPGDEPEVLAVHRPRYDDWSLPKGKCDPGESDAACALREVLEETGYACSLAGELTQIDYVDQKGRPKTVVYFLMEPLTGEFAPNSEVDELRWCRLDDAEALLTYPHDAEIARAALEARPDL
jgi:8-oxo-dGTP pyrophosphatase MutT (NUDIX family)